MNKFYVVFLLAVFGLVLFRPVTHFATMETVSGVVITEKERISTRQGSRFMVWTENEVFENTDSLLSFKFNSADIYGKLPVGSTCDLKVNGWRVPFLSWNRNILSVSCA